MIYYKDEFTTIYLGDAREILSTLKYDAIITDPVWPNATADLFGKEDPHGMLKSVLDIADCERIAIHLGCDSDPRFLTAVPDKWKFFRTVWLELVQPHYKGRLMYGSDVAYLFGEPPPSKKGQHVIPGRYTDADSKGKQTKHPCPRKTGHVQWLIKWWTAEGETVCDPFMGSGTTNFSAAKMGIKSIGIEYEEKYCEMAAKRFEQTRMFAPCEIG